MSDFTQVPIIKFDLQHAREHIAVAVATRSDEISEMVQESLDEFCTVENLQRIINQHVGVIIPEIIKTELDNFYKYGDGRAVIKEAVIARLQDE